MSSKLKRRITRTKVIKKTPETWCGNCMEWCNESQFDVQTETGNVYHNKCGSLVGNFND